MPAADRFTFADSVWIAATPRQVYDVVSDVTRTGEWSVFTRSCAWEETDGPAVGAHFVGHNSRPGRDWDTRATVTAAEPGRAFAWEIGDGGVHWGYEMAPEPSGPGVEGTGVEGTGVEGTGVEGTGPEGAGVDGTRLTHTWRLTGAGRAMIAGLFPDDPDGQITLRVDDAHASIPTTLAALKRVVESSS